MSTINLANANSIAIRISAVANDAATLAGTAPYADFADMLIALDPVDCNSACYTLILSCTSKGWNIAKTALREVLKARGYKFDSAGPDWRKKDDRKVPFTLVTIEQAKADKAAKDAEEEAKQATFRAEEIARKELIELERDKEITSSTLVATLLAECSRLGLDSGACLNELAETLGYSVAPKFSDAEVAASVASAKPVKQAAKPAKV